MAQDWRRIMNLQRGRPDWYRISNQGGDGPAEIYIYDEIGFWGVDAQDFVKELVDLKGQPVDLHLSSPGGEVFAGISIYNALRAYKGTVNVVVDSLAASIASVIAMAGDEIVMAPHSQMMIHDASGVVIGNSTDMAEMATLLDKQSDNIASIYADRTGTDVATWRTAMRAETWYSDEEAVTAKLADRVADNAPATTNKLQAEPAFTWDPDVFKSAIREVFQSD